MEFNVAFEWRTPIVQLTYPNHAAIKPGLVRHAYETERRAAGPFASGVAPYAKSGLYESPFDLFNADVPEVRALRQFCAESVAALVSGLYRRMNLPGVDPNADVPLAVQVPESWLHITRDGGYHDVHTHAGFSWCGIYYVQAGDAPRVEPPNGATRFYPPYDLGYEDFGSIVYRPGVFQAAAEEGKLILFPGYVRHSGLPYRGKADRILVAFNARVSRAPATA